MKHNWTYKKLTDVAAINYGTRVVQKRDGGTIYPVYGGGDATFRMDTYNRENCLVVARFAMSPKCTRRVVGKFFLNDSGLTLEAKEGVCQDYLDWHIIALNDEIYRTAKGAAQKNLDVKTFTSLSIGVPSLDEQQAIVRELDGINHLIDLQEEQLREYDRLAQSLFYTTFGDPVSNPKGWEIKKMGEVCDVKGRIGFRGYTRNDFVDSEKEGAISLSPTNIVNNHMDYTKCAYVTWDKYNESPEIMVQMGDILLVKTGSSYGKCAFVDYLPHESTINPQFVVIKNHKISSRYLTAYLQCDAARIKYDEFVLGTAIPTFSQKSLNSMPVPIPPLALQQTFAAQIEAIEQQKALIRRSLDETRTLLAQRMDYHFN